MLRNQWFISSLTGTGIMMTFLLRNNIAPVVPVLKQQLKLDDFQMGLALSSFLWAYTALQPFAGWAADRYGARKSLLIGMLAMSIITIFTGFASSIVTLILFRVGLGVAQSPNFVTGAKVSSSGWVDVEHKARATSVWIAGGRIGTAIAFPFSALLAVLYGWQWVFFGTGILGVLWCIVWYREFHDHPEDDQQGLRFAERVVRRWRTQDLRFLMRPLTLGLAVASFGQGYLAYYISTWLPDYLVREQKLTVLTAGVYALLPILSAVAGIVFVGGILSDRQVKNGAARVGSRSKLFSTGMILASIMLFVTAYSRKIADATSIGFFSSPGFAVASLSLAGAAWGVATPSLWAALVEATPKELTGTMGGIQNLGGNLGGITVLVLTGYILQITNQSSIALVTVGVFALLAATSAIILVGRERNEARSRRI